MMRGRAQGGGLQTLRDRLTRQKNLEVKELKLDAAVKKVPDDASVVVVARPTRTMPPAGVDSLRTWMRAKKGKLMVLLDPVIREQGDSRVMVPTGLEGLLAEYSVKVGNDLVYNAVYTDPRAVEAFTNPEAQNPVARAFFQHPQLATVFAFLEGTRTVEPAAKLAGPGQGPTAESLLGTQEQVYWVEKDLNVNPAAMAAQIRRDAQFRAKKLAEPPISLAVAVSEGGSGDMPRDMAHRGLFKDKPRMVVFGNASWISDESLRARPSQADLFTSCLSWLRERPDIGKPPE